MEHGNVNRLRMIGIYGGGYASPLEGGPLSENRADLIPAAR